MILQKMQFESVTTGPESTYARRAAWVCGVLASGVLAACAGGSPDGRGSDPAPPPPPPVIAAPPGPSGAELRPPELRAQPGPCTAGAGFRCFTLRVDLDRSRRTATARGRLTLSVAVERGGTPSRGYLLALSGGPGKATLPLGSELRRTLGSVDPGYRLVLIDQRGTGKGALDCPGLQGSVGSSDVAVAPRGAVEACARRVGRGLDDFATTDTVADLDALREALGAQRLTLAGVSYGTLVAQRYALTHPDRVRGLVLDSVVPERGADVLLRSRLDAVPRVLRRVCRSEQCPGDVAADLRAALAFGADDVALLDTLVARTIGPPRLQPVLSALREAARGRLGALDDLAARTRLRATAADAADFSTALHATTLCAESRTPWGNATAVPADREQALAQARAQLTPARLGGFEPATAVENGLADTCRRWPPLASPPKRPTGSLPDVPTLLLAGELDLVTPLEDAQDGLRRTPGGRLLIVPGAGHGLLASDASGCALEAVRLLLAGRRPPARCG